mmetsp:Transcript_30285/g.40441  ORF Transcript_30285/g.40441 Transcript_30285/m.40441 type:complete len:83 (-) Transcript_30285:875-1123(-)
MVLSSLVNMNSPSFRLYRLIPPPPNETQYNGKSNCEVHHSIGAYPLQPTGRGPVGLSCIIAESRYRAKPKELNIIVSHKLMV